MSMTSTLLKEVTVRITKGTTPTTLGKSFKDDGINFIKAEALNGDPLLDEKGFTYIDEETNEILKRSKLQKDDVLITIAGANIGKCGIVKEKHLPANTNQAVGIVRIDITKACPKFIYYYFKQNYFFNYIQSLNAQAAQPNINLSMLGSIALNLPVYCAQEKTEKLISKYDDLIENNLRRIELLEESARLLYREWFVHLRFPGHEHTKITNGVPEGWEKGVISNFYNTSSGGTPSRKNPDFFNGGIKWVKTQELNNRFIIDTQEKITEDGVNKSSAKIFPKQTVLIAMYGATIGQLGILAYPSASNQACCALMPKHEDANCIYVFLFLKESKQRLFNLSMGSAQNNINQQMIKDFMMFMPSKIIMENFVETLKPSFEMILNLQNQIELLKQARDILLPRLMNGDIAV